MKKIYFIALSLMVFTTVNAQITLTQATNEPIISDVYYTKGLDTTGFNMPNTVTGNGVTWAITQAIDNGVLDTIKYVAPSTFTNSANFTGATVASVDASGTVTYYKSTPGQLEVRGLDGGFYDLNFSNTAMVSVYPVAFGYTNNDGVGGTITAAGMSGPFTGSIVTTADGTGTLDINGVTILTNCLRVKSVQNITFSLSFGLVTGSVDQTVYNYYHSSSKFPILTANYQHLVTAGLQTLDNSTALVSVQQNIDLVTGLKNNTVNEVVFKAYPNPATNQVNLHFVITKNESYVVNITNALGQVVATENYSNLNAGVYNQNINIANLKAGIYTIAVTGNNSKGVEKLIVQ